jgi:glyoxylase I family protein
MVQGFEHVAIASPDPQRLAQWYVEKLGFIVNYNSGRTVFVKSPNGSMIEIITSEGDRGRQTLKDPGLRHIALAVDDFQPAYQSLKAAGVQFLDEPAEAKGNWVVFFQDADGNYLHLIQRGTPLP